MNFSGPASEKNGIVFMGRNIKVYLLLDVIIYNFAECRDMIQMAVGKNDSSGCKVFPTI